MVITLTGENDVLRGEALDHLLNTFTVAHGDIGLERLDGEEADYARMHEAAETLPFLAPRKLVVLRKPSANKEFTEKFEQFIAAVAETNDIVLVEPKLDKRQSYYKQLKKLTDFREFAVLDANGLARYLSDYVKAQGGSLTLSDARLLVDRVGANQLILKHEADKLLAYDPHITRGSIELLTERTPQSSIFELLDTAFAGDARRAMRLYDEQREARVEPQQIMAMLAWQLHLVAVAKAAGSRSADTIAAEAKLSPFTMRKAAGLARRISLARLKALVHELRVFDMRLKSEAINADETVRYYLLRLALTEV